MPLLFGEGLPHVWVRCYVASDSNVLCVLCRHAVSDMAWTPDGMTILACSGDGTIALLMFSEKELGGPLSQVRQIWRHVLRNHCPGPSPQVASMHTWSVDVTWFQPFCWLAWKPVLGPWIKPVCRHLVCGIMHSRHGRQCVACMRTARTRTRSSSAGGGGQAHSKPVWLLASAADAVCGERGPAAPGSCCGGKAGSWQHGSCPARSHAPAQAQARAACQRAGCPAGTGQWHCAAQSGAAVPRRVRPS